MIDIWHLSDRVGKHEPGIIGMKILMMLGFYVPQCFSNNPTVTVWVQRLNTFNAHEENAIFTALVHA